MAAGNNAGDQLNVFILECVMVTRAEATDAPPRVTSVSIHPLAVVPTSIRYSDGTRSTVRQTHGSSIVTKGGRALRQVAFEGTFGVEERGLGPYTGTGAQRFERFYHEIVRLPDAVTREQINAELNLLRSPVLSAALPRIIASQRLQDPTLERTTFTVNYFDLWHQIAFEALITGFNFTKMHRDGGATGNTRYSLQIQEVGPIVTGGLTNSMIRGLFEGLTRWDDLNETIRSYTLDGVLDALFAGANIPLTELADSLGAFKAQIDGATGVMNGYQPSTQSVVKGTAADVANIQAALGNEVDTTDTDNGSSTLMSHMGFAQRIVEQGAEILDALLTQGPARRVDTIAGAVDWSTVTETTTIDGLDAVDRIDSLAAVIDAARFQEVVGVLYGMSRDEYAAFMSASGVGGRPPTLHSSTPHVVTAYDTAALLEQLYNVSFDDILRLNGDILPDEALVAGRELQIPQSRALAATARIDGLPVFDSHAGRSAWGKDLWVDLRTDADGRLLICDDTDVLVQGLNWIVSAFAAELQELREQTPAIAQEFVLTRWIASLILSDKRFISVESVGFERGPDGASLHIAPVVTAINGGSVGAA